MATHIIVADALSALREAPDDCVQMVCTSPPYFGLRDYQTATWLGGDPECDHRTKATGTKQFGNPEFNENRPSREATKTADHQFRDRCGKCGAQRVDLQVGLEDAPQAYVERLVEIFLEVKRVLRDDGCFWLNIGDSYAGSSMSGGSGKGTIQGTQHFAAKGSDIRFSHARKSDIKKKRITWNSMGRCRSPAKTCPALCRMRA